jgi:hypothetical protein
MADVTTCNLTQHLSVHTGIDNTDSDYPAGSVERLLLLQEDQGADKVS